MRGVELVASIYWLRPGDAPAEVRARLAALLDDEERTRGARFAFERDRELYLFAHGLTRHALGRHLDLDPRALRFTATADGRPELAEPARPVRFNLSHTPGLVACVICAAPCGVDVEHLGRARILREVLAPSEIALLDALPEPDRAAGFRRFWTLKEAYLKARGVGIAVSLPAIAFRPEPVPVLAASPFPDEDPAAWRLWSATPTPDHHAACAVLAGALEVRFEARDATAVLP